MTKRHLVEWENKANSKPIKANQSQILSAISVAGQKQKNVFGYIKNIDNY